MKFIKQLVTCAMHRQLSKLDGLYQRNSGQECYIFGNGVSLKWMDLRQFTDRTSILGNMFIYHNEVNALSIPYCTITEPYWFWPFFPCRVHGKFQLSRDIPHKEYRKSIIQNPDTLFFLNVSNYPFARFPNALYVSRWYEPPFETRNPFKDRSDAHHGTFRFQIALAIFLGFKKAYLLGHDYTHFPSKSIHFYEKGEGILNGNRNFSYEFINYAKQYIDMVTVTLDGSSETMKSITYRELTGKEPRFRENVEIIDRAKLESLAEWHGYSIF
ncbi:MAG: hypothetical protein L6290_10685 [Thermodesulfovibrionales bacterium]|nr:hypothetical protein [Thermodesulfovibrionales bacterium]